MTADPVRCVAEFLSLGTGTDLARSALTGEVRPIRTSIAGAAEACSAFRPPEAQIDHLCRELGLPTERRGALRSLLDGLLEDGILASDRSIVDALRQRGAGGAIRRLRHVGVVTKDRPASLERCVRSYAENAEAHGRSVVFTVADQSVDPATHAANVDVLRRLRADHGCRTLVIGEAERRAFAAALTEDERIPAELVAFALGDPLGLGCAIGANRNALVLASVGDRMVCTDDDMVCRPLGGLPRPELVVRAEATPVDVAFGWDRSVLLGAVPSLEIDALGVHERMLGRSLAAIAAGFSAVDLGGASLPTLREALTGDVRVRATQCGHAGDSGMGSTAWVLAQRGSAIDPWLTTEATYHAATRSREIVRSTTAYTVSDADDLMAGSLGLDLDVERPVPPFFPVLRNEDGLFGSHLRLTAPESRIGFCPVALVHAPPETRANAPDAGTRGAGRLSCVDLVLLGLATAPRMSGPQRLVTLGRWFEELGGLRPAAFEAWLRDGHWRRCTLEVERLRELLEVNGDQPPWWARDVRDYLATVGERAAMPAAHVPVELARDRGPDEALAVARKLLRLWGRLLVVWPELWAAAGRIRARGGSFARTA